MIGEAEKRAAPTEETSPMLGFNGTAYFWDMSKIGKNLFYLNAHPGSKVILKK